MLLAAPTGLQADDPTGVAAKPVGPLSPKDEQGTFKLRPGYKIDLVASEPDPTDGRKTLLSATPAASEMYTSMRESRELWLIRAIAEALTVGERAVIVEATALLERLAAADLT